jgi:uncharacterized damage-inducible protein DinB
MTSWIAPDVTRADQPRTGDERTGLQGWLDWHRSTLLWKCQGLDAEQLCRRAVDPSPLSLLGLIRHMTEVERSWFRRGFRGESVGYAYATEEDHDADFNAATPGGAQRDYQALKEEWKLADAAAVGAGLDETREHPRHGATSLRWIYVHVIEEYARHNGHADLLRERIDGVIGD